MRAKKRFVVECNERKDEKCDLKEGKESACDEKL